MTASTTLTMSPWYNPPYYQGIRVWCREHGRYVKVHGVNSGPDDTGGTNYVWWVTLPCGCYRPALGVFADTNALLDKDV